MKAGLGPRYAFYGPFETIHLNANGVDDYIQKYTAGVRNVTADFGPNPTFEEENVIEKLREFLYKAMPLTKLKEEGLARENKLATLALVKEKFD
ncbi:unnamed protein product [Auanema sp. JU1783]|nr:unnamed protein product [Auanema sp. JU1783]